MVATGQIKHGTLKVICDALVEAFDQYSNHPPSMSTNPHPFFRSRGASDGYDIAVSTAYMVFICLPLFNWYDSANVRACYLVRAVCLPRPSMLRVALASAAAWQSASTEVPAVCSVEAELFERPHSRSVVEHPGGARRR